jgi:cGMP-dependent protein kinase
LPEPAPFRQRLAVGPGTGIESRQLGELAETSKDVKDLLRTVVSGGTDREVTHVQPPSPKTIEDIKLMVAAVKRNRNLQTVMTMEDKLCNAMIEMAWKTEVKAGTNVIEEGDLDSDCFYIVAEGTLEVFVNGVQVLNINKGGSFGELALLYYAPRAATVTASTNSVLWVIDRSHFKAILNRTTEEHLHRYVKHMHHMDGMEKLPKRVRMEVANALEEYRFNEGDVIYRFGEPLDSFWFFIEGEVEIEKKGKTERQTGDAEHPIVLGDTAMGENPGTRKETVAVVSPMAVGVTINRYTFDMLLRKVDMEKQYAEKKAKGQSMLKFGSNEYETEEFEKNHVEHLRLKDLQIKGTLGVGGFGLVELAYHSRSDKIYALKTISKGYVMKAGLQTNVLHEKNCMFLCEDCPFVVKLVETFSTTQTIGFLQEAEMGGDLFECYRREKFWGRLEHTKFYVAGVVLAFEYIHSKRIVYRDLKPENILLDKKGYPQLTDFGWAKLSPGKTYTVCGALVSMAPEVIKCVGHNRGADWWTLGVMLYELLSRETPFAADSPTGIYAKIFTGIDRVDFSKAALKGDAEDLIKNLCVQLPTCRLPMQFRGVAKLKKHPWYKGFDWSALQNLHLPAPYVPTIGGQFDLSNFRSDLTAEIPMQNVPVVDDDDENTITRSISISMASWDEAFATSC